MNFQLWAREVADQYLTNEDLAKIRKTAVEMAENIDSLPASTVLLKMLNHTNLIMADKSAVEEKLLDRETRLKAMEIAYFELVVERDLLKEKLGVRI